MFFLQLITSFELTFRIGVDKINSNEFVCERKENKKINLNNDMEDEDENK